MDDAVAKTIQALAVAAIGGLTFIAYRHPKSYRAISGKLQALAFAAIAVGMAYNFGLSRARQIVSQSDPLTSDQIAKIGATIVAEDLSFWPAGAVAIGLTIYLIFLDTFPWWLLEEKPVQKERDRE